MANIIDLLRPGQDIKFDNSTSGLTATNLNAAIDEIEGRLDTVETDSGTLSTNVSNLITLSGLAANSANLGTFTGGIITDNSTVKTALQELETEVELKADDADVIKKDGSVAFTADQSMGGFKLTNLATPTAAGDATTKAYVDLVSTSGTRHKGSAIVATTGNITLSGTQTIDGVAVVADDIVLVKDQTDATENGAYTVAAGAWTRTDNFDGAPSNEIQGGDLIYVDQGTVNANTLFFVMGTGEKAIDVDDIEFDIFSRAESITASNGLTKVGLDVRLDASSAGAGLGFSAGVLSVNVDDASLEIATDTVRIKDLGVTTAKLDATSVTAAKLASDVAGTGLAGGNGSALTVEYSTTGEADHAVEASSLAATTTGLGASLVGVFDTADNFTATTVEGVLAELQGNIDNVAASVSTWSVITSATTAVNGGQYAINSTSGAVTLTLPATPTVGHWVRVFDAGRAVATNSITVARNGELIQAVADDVVNSSVEGSDNTYVFIGGLVGWAITA